MPDPGDLDGATDQILGVVLAASGYDFTRYQRSFVVRRLHRVAERHQLVGGIAELATAVTADDTMSGEIIEALGVGVTEMFRDPPFWAALRPGVMPALADMRGPLRLWVAGCASGEEALSLAVLVAEAGLMGRTRIYATDINERGLARARTMRVGTDVFSTAETNYALAGGGEGLDRSFEPDETGAQFTAAGRDSFVFSRHNLATDAAFNSFHLVLCRNVLIYFDRDLHRSAHDILFDSLLPGAVLGLGWRESVQVSPYRRRYETLDARARLYRRRR